MKLFGIKREHGQKGQEYWQRHHRRWEKSGMSQSAYCRREGISLSSFTYWRSRLTSIYQECSDFIEVKPSVSTECHTEHIELTIPTIGVIRIPTTINPESLRVILLTVKEMI